MRKSRYVAAAVVLAVLVAVVALATSSPPAVTITVPANFKGQVAVRAQGGTFKVDGTEAEAGSQGVFIWQREFLTVHSAVVIELDAPLWVNYYYKTAD